MRVSAKRVTSVDVARRAGVSQSTVSRTFNLDARISDETRQRVLAAAQELGYKPNAIARSLITRSTGIIGIVMADMLAPFYPYVLQKFTARFQASGRQVMLFNITPEQEMKDALPMAMQYQVDGVIITSATLSSALANECARRGLPVILFNRYARTANVSAVSCDNEHGARMVVDHLLSRGHKRLAFVSGKHDTSTNTDRERGFIEQLKVHGIDKWLYEPGGEYTYEAGRYATLRLMQCENPPDAIFCANDSVAIGAMDAIRFDLGLRVPQDVSVVGFDDIPQAALPTYNLTTVQQRVDEMIDLAIDLLDRRLENPDMPHEYRTVPGTFIERGSVR